MTPYNSILVQIVKFKSSMSNYCDVSDTKEGGNASNKRLLIEKMNNPSTIVAVRLKDVANLLLPQKVYCNCIAAVCQLVELRKLSLDCICILEKHFLEAGSKLSFFSVSSS